MNISIIGGGNMGLTYAKAFLKNHIIAPERLSVVERNIEKHDSFHRLSISNIHLACNEHLRDSDIVVLATKPQDVLSLVNDLRPFISEDVVLLSIMAGISMNTLSEGLKRDKIIRAMPNIPALVGEGMTVFTASHEVTRKELTQIQNLLNTTGKTLYTDEEKMIDAATAISGSGPAYVYFFMKQMMTTARSLGFSVSEAELLVFQTFMGATELYAKENYTCSEWIEKISSKGGTTEAALKTLEELQGRKAFDTAIVAAQKRAVELSK